MHVDAEGEKKLKAKPRRQGRAIDGGRVSAPTRKLSVRLSEKIVEQLETATELPGVGKSMVVEAALERFFDPVPPVEALMRDQLDRLGHQLERLENKIRLIAETVALHARFHLTITPPLPQPRQRAACALGQKRFEILAEQVERRLRLGRPLMGETINLLRSKNPDSSTRKCSCAAEAVQEPPTLAVEGKPEMSAAAQEGGSNRNFRQLPNAFCASA